MRDATVYGEEYRGVRTFCRNSTGDCTRYRAAVYLGERLRSRDCAWNLDAA